MSPYVLESRWRVAAPLDEILEVMADPTDLPRWWGSVYDRAVELDPGDPARGGVGKTVAIRAHGFLPYRLDFTIRVTESRHPYGLSVAVAGDLEGDGHWYLAEEGEVVDMRHVWRVRPRKRVVAALTPLLWPLFAWNHHWTMRRGEESLRRELARRRATSRPRSSR